MAGDSEVTMNGNGMSFSGIDDRKVPLASIKRTLTVTRALLDQLRAFRAFERAGIAERACSPAPAALVSTLLRLGPAFVKLGQILSTRPDFMPSEYIEALSSLHERVPPFAFDQVEYTVARELGVPLRRAFAEFDSEPVASASLAQVHFAALPSGEPVAVKVRRPGVEEQIERDLRVLRRLVRLGALAAPRLARRLDLQGAFEEFGDYTRRELDFSLEGRTLERFRRNFEGIPGVVFPSVYWSHTTPRLLTMQRVSGLRLHEVPGRLSVEARRRLNQRLVEMEMKMFVGDAFFHADLHPGNVFFGEDGGISVIDVGMFGELTDEQRDRFLLYWHAVANEEVERAFHHVTRLLVPTRAADAGGYRRVFGRILDEFYRCTITEKSWTKTFLEVVTQACRFGYRVPRQMLLEAKALTTAESLAFTLAPDSRFTDTARPIVVRELAKRARSKWVRQRLEATLPEWLLMGELPPPGALSERGAESKDVWREVLRVWAEEMDDHPRTAREVIHGDHTVIVDEEPERVFNFVTRFARYECWHPTYTQVSRVIHVGGEWMFLTPEVVGSVFRIDEIADGYHVQSNGVVTEFERNRRFKWRAPFSLCPLLHIGTYFEVARVAEGRARLYEHFYYLENDLLVLFTHRPWLGSLRALKDHIREELNGVKRILESGAYAPEDVTYLWEGVSAPVRVAQNYLRPAAVTEGPRPQDRRIQPSTESGLAPRPIAVRP
jgi:predicted unusual protein kinase regulating ubiquinone biosynthesis (AarF/ABC1/UbiB family)